MKIRYIFHSGFLLEWPACYWLIDYWQGDVPSLDPNKGLLIFASHSHMDHYNPKNFDMGKNAEYILSSDIEPAKTENILSVNPNKNYRLSDGKGGTIEPTTLASTKSMILNLAP